MPDTPLAPLKMRLSSLPDPRIPRTRRYPLADLLLILLCGLLAGANTFVAIITWATLHQDFLKEKLDIAAIPSHDTLNRVMAKLDPQALAALLNQWSMTLWQQQASEEEKQISFDGKVIKGALGKLTLVSAFATQARLILSAIRVPENSNEIPTMREILSFLWLHGCLVSADAAHCQKETAQLIRERGGDYVLALKENHAYLFESPLHYFTPLREGKAWELIDASFAWSIERAHGQVEKRRAWLICDPLLFDPLEEWPDLAGVACVERSCYRGKALVRCEARYFLVSRADSAKSVLKAVRNHWLIENGQHWLLDVVFREDACRVQRENASVNLAFVRRLALNLLRSEKSIKAGIENKRQRAGWSTDYLEKILTSEQREKQD